MDSTLIDIFKVLAKEPYKEHSLRAIVRGLDRPNRNYFEICKGKLLNSKYVTYRAGLPKGDLAIKINQEGLEYLTRKSTMETMHEIEVHNSKVHKNPIQPLPEPTKSKLWTRLHKVPQWVIMVCAIITATIALLGYLKCQ